MKRIAATVYVALFGLMFAQAVLAQLSSPSLLTPSNGATGISITPSLDWSDVSGASSYRVFVHTNQSTLSSLSATATTCSGCLVNTTTSGSSYTVSSGVLANSTTYYWMVRAGSSTGGSPNSAIRSFTTVAGSLTTPSLLSPANGATGVPITPSLDWSDVSGASSYRVFVHTSQSTLSSLSATTTTCSGCLVNTTTSGSSYTVSSGVLTNSTTYYWMVRAGSSTAGSPNSAIRSFTTVAGSLTTPSLLSPANGATGVPITPSLDWSDVSGASSYRVFVHTSQSTLSSLSATTTTCSGCLVNTTTSGSSYTVSSGVLANSTTYYWMVRAGGSTGGSPNSAIRSFTTMAGSLTTPSLLSPANGATGVSVTPSLDWSDVSGASSYRMFVHTDQATLSSLSATTTTCSGCLVNTTTSSSSYTVSSGTLSDSTTYYWMVRAGSSTSGSPNSAIRSFTTVAGSLTTPSLLSPSNGATEVSLTPSLDWSDVSGASMYRVFVSTSQSTLSSLSATATTCSGCLVNTITSGSSYMVTLGTLSDSTTYYWMVRAGSSTAGSPNSAIRSLTTASASLPAPALVSPSNSATGVSTTPLLDWSTVTGATRYRVFASTNQSVLSSLSPLATTCTGCVLNQEILSGGSSQYQLQPGQALANATTYYWMVRAGNATAGSPHSLIWSFTTMAVSLPRPTLQNPTNGATGVSTLPALTWTSVTDAQRYRIFVSTSQSILMALDNVTSTCPYSCIVNGEVTTSATYTVPSTQRLASGTTYYWLVRAGSDQGGSPNSAIWSFTTAAGTANSPTGLVPRDGTQNVNFSAALLGWSLNNPASNVSRVELTLREGNPATGALGSFVGDCQQKRIGVVTSYSSTSCGALQPGTWYRYTVEVVFTDGVTRTGANAFFRTEARSVARFEFTLIPAVQQVDVPFSVTISGVDETGTLVSDFNGEVEISCPHSQVTPKFIHFSGGRWSDVVELDAPSKATTLRVRLGPVFGESSTFWVFPQTSLPGHIVGFVKEAAGAEDLTVILNDSQNREVAVTSALDGNFSFRDLPAGTYSVKADSLILGRKSIFQTVVVPSGQPVTVELELVPAERPVLIVPGIMGSTLATRPDNDLYPRLPRDYPAPAWELKIFDPSLGLLGEPVGLSTLETALKSRNYKPFRVPWDWRVPVISDGSSQNPVAWQYYLKRAIEDAKEATGFSKVDVIAHSMGGLMTREYIQSDSFAWDIDKFAMVGTPNHGAANAYYIVEGGDPKKADDLNEGIFTGWLNFYANTTNILHKTTYGHYAFAWDNIASAFNLDKLAEGVTRSGLRNFFYEKVYTAVQLLPIYNGSLLRKESVSSEPQETHMKDINTGLRDLNTSSTRFRMALNSSDPLKVRTKLFLSAGESTIYKIYIGDPGTDGTYPMGKPYPYYVVDYLGDGTVPSALPDISEELDFVSPLQPSAKGPHSGLLKTFAEDLALFLEENRTKNFTTETVDLKTVPREPDLSIAVVSRVQPFLLDPTGHGSGVVPTTGEFLQTIAGSEVKLLPSSSMINVVKPANGKYTLQFSGPYQENEEISLTFIYSDEQTRYERTLYWLYHGGALQIPFDLEAGIENSIRLNSSLAPPRHLRASEEGDSWTLNWSAPSDLHVQGYRVYGRKREEPRYVLLGESSETRFMTGHPLARNPEEVSWYYTVVAYNGTDESSFVEVVPNFVAPKEPGTCVPIRTLQCGVVDSWSTVGGANSLSNYGCLARSYSGPEVVYLFEPEANTHVQLSLGSLSENLDVIILGSPEGSCQASHCLAQSLEVGTANKTVRFSAIGGHRYHVLVDGVDGAAGGYNLQVNCEGSTFSDVPSDFWASLQIQALYNAGVTTGCAPQRFCPADSVTRDQMAVFIERSLKGQSFTPPAATGVFSDIPADFWAAGWIEQFYRDGITTGCAVTPLRYCPVDLVTRDQMAVFLLRARHGASYVPPPAVGTFSDVPANFWAAAWIEQLHREGISTGCAANPLRYCPGQTVTRAEMAVFLTRTFGLPLP